MASLKLLLSHARRQYLLKPSCSSPFLHFTKYLSSSYSSSASSNDNNDDSPPPKPQPIPVQPVSYSVKPKQPPPENETPDLASHSPQQQESRLGTIPPPPRGDSVDSTWTREDIRYVKDAGPSISPVSYSARVAPLPDDRVREEEGDKEEMRAETRRIEVDNSSRRILRRTRVPKMFEEEGVKVPFPTLIKVEKKEKKPVYDLAEAIRLVKANAKANFSETVEAHVRLGIERKRSDLIVRGSLVLPHGGGMKVAKIAFLGEGADADEARAAGADIVGGAELVEQIANGGGKFNVQKCFTTPAFMPNVLKIAKILKPLGLVPNAKQGTLISDVAQAVREAKQSNVDFRMDKASIVHVGLGKVSLSEEDLHENIGAFVNALLRAKPAGLKKASKYAGYVNSFHVCSTMGPGFPVSIQSLSKAADHYNKVHLS